MRQKNASQLALAEESIELGCRQVNQKQNEYPNLDRGKAMPTEDRSQVRQEFAQGMAVHEKLDEGLEQASDEHKDPVHERFVQDRLEQRRAIVAAKERHRVGDQHRLADNEPRSGGEHEVADGNSVIGEDQIGRQYDQVEADQEEYHRRQDFAQLMQKPCTQPANTRGRGRLSGGY